MKGDVNWEILLALLYLPAAFCAVWYFADFVRQQYFDPRFPEEKSN